MQSRRFSVTFSEEAYDELAKLAKIKRTSMATVIRDALTLESYVHRELGKGGTMFFRYPDGSQREISIH